MSAEVDVLLALALLSSIVITGAVFRYALRSNLLDVPNSRSSHAAPTPRGGGLAIVAVFGAGLLLLSALRLIDASNVVSILPGALAVAAAGFVDDRRGLSPAIRFAVHLGAAFSYLAIVGGPPRFGITWLDDIPWLGFAVTLFGLVWLLNLFNFMDGIDGIAGTELACVSLGLVLVVQISGAHCDAQLLAALLGVAGIGFLAWNWPPAKIFMGDVGSGFVGITLGMIALETMRECGVTVWVPVVLLGAFLTDATLTLLRRALRGEKLAEAHRTHAYQWLSRRWGSHQRVVYVLLVINLLWLLPLALWAQRFPRSSWLIAVVAYLPLVALACWAGAGRPEGILRASPRSPPE